MLQFIRDNTTGWIAIAIVGFLIIPFAFWGINYYFEGGQEPVVAKVNGEDIKLSEFQRAFANFRTQMQAMLEKNLSPEDEEVLKDETLNKLVTSEVLKQESMGIRLRISDEQVKETIKNIDVFNSESGFSRDFYEQSVMRLGMTPASYEYQLRLDLMSEQIQSAIVESEFATPLEARQAAMLLEQKRDFTYAIIPSSQFRDSITVTDADIEQFYSANHSLYMSPEQVRIAYLELNLDNLAGEVEVNEEELQKYYQIHRDDFDQEEQRKITQVLVKTDADMNDEQKSKARSELENILKQAKSGKALDEIIEEYKDNPDLKLSYVEMGFVNRGVLEKEVDQVVFSMDVDQISDIVESGIGFHIIRLDDIRGGIMNTFENHRDEVDRAYRNEQAKTRFFEMADQLATLSYEHTDTLAIASEELGLELKESDYFGQQYDTGEGILADPKVIAASFSEDVLNRGYNSDLLEISDKHLVVLRVVDHREKAVIPLAEVRDRVIEDIRADRSRKLAREFGEKLVAELKSGTDLSQLSGQEQVEWNSLTGVERTDVSVNRSVLRKAFRLGQPEPGKSITGGIVLGTGDYAVIVLEGVTNPDPDTIDSKDIEDAQVRLSAARSAGSWQQYLNDMMDNSDIRMFRDRVR